MTEEMAATLSLYACYGLQITEIKQNIDTTHFKVSVPEKIETTEIKVSGKELLKEFKKDVLEAMYSICVCKTDEDKELLNDMIKVFGRIREGEKWTSEDYERHYGKLMDAIRLEKGYKEV